MSKQGLRFQPEGPYARTVRPQSDPARRSGPAPSRPGVLLGVDDLHAVFESLKIGRAVLVDAEVYVEAASGPKEVRWYDTDHYFNEEARRDREEWLGRALEAR